MRLGSFFASSLSFSNSALRLASSVAFKPGFPRGPVFVGGPDGCLLSQINGGRIVEVLITLRSLLALH